MKVSYEPGWGAGTIRVGTEHVCNFLEKSLEVTVKGKRYPAEVIKAEGVDYDHGHEYPFSYYDIFLTVPHPIFGKQLVGCREIFQGTKVKKVEVRVI
ncbi:hypothetical protein N9112_00330 [bacterium]|nr:hypothetical protein [bacterium]